MSKLIKGITALESALKNVRGQALIPYVQQLGASTIEHMREYGDHTLLSRLALAIPGTLTNKTSKRAQFVAWVERHTWLIYNTVDKWFVKTGADIADLDTILDTPWYVEPPKVAAKPKVQKVGLGQALEALGDAKKGTSAPPPGRTAESESTQTMEEYMVEVANNMRTMGANLVQYQTLIAALSTDRDELLTLANLAKAA